MLFRSECVLRIYVEDVEGLAVDLVPLPRIMTLPRGLETYCIYAISQDGLTGGKFAV